jgi:hypothetical protein
MSSNTMNNAEVGLCYITITLTRYLFCRSGMKSFSLDLFPYTREKTQSAKHHSFIVYVQYELLITIVTVNRSDKIDQNIKSSAKVHIACDQITGIDLFSRQNLGGQFNQ